MFVLQRLRLITRRKEERREDVANVPPRLWPVSGPQRPGLIYNNNNDFISIALFHVKHAELR